MSSRSVSRRSILRSSAAFGLFTIIPGGLARGFAANEKVNVGVIGVMGIGISDRRELVNAGANIVALCDVDRRSLEAAHKEHLQARTWVDFRKMLEEQKEIDAVMVCTPDHLHYPASMLAMKLGKHVCTEKPMAHSVWEARQLGLAAKKYKVATQHDHEGHSSDGLRTAVEWIKSGAIGTVREVHIFTDRPIWPQGIAKRPPSKPAPPHLEWDLWIGPAPYREYHDGLHPFSWRGWWDFGTGALGDMGCHFWDSTVWALDLGHPTTVEAVQEGNSEETGPNWSTVTYHFPAKGDRPAVKVTWWDGRRPNTDPNLKDKNGNMLKVVQNLPPRPEELEPDRRFPSNGSLFIGDKGKLLVADTNSPRLIPESKMKEFERPKPFIPRVPGGHKAEWLRACKGGPPCGSDFGLFGAHLAEVVLLGNLAIRTGRKIEWDGENLKATNCPEADRYIRREYRKGWDV